jgi:hypothetical protein
VDPTTENHIETEPHGLTVRRRTNMVTGVFKLDELHEFARSHPDVPQRTKDKATYKAYREVVTRLLERVPTDPGWYVWFRRGPVPAHVYIGQSNTRKTSSLRVRLLDELTEEYVAIWTTVDSDAAEKLTAKWPRKYNLTRALAKQNANTIAWLAWPHATDGLLDVVEYKLIQDLAPTGNKDKRDYSTISVQEYSQVKESFSKMLSMPL